MSAIASASAGFFGLNQNVTNAHLIRAVYEGISLSIRDCLSVSGNAKTLYLAGGFGNCIDVGSAAAIGLIPQQLADAAKPVGNAAGAGAAVLLLDKEKKAASETLAANAKNLELSTDPYFMDQYVEQMMFGGDDYM